MCVSHSTFLHIVDLVSASVQDSIHPLTGRVQQTREFKVAVALYPLGHGGTWQMTAKTCAIGISTAKGYMQKVVAAVITHGKPWYMPGKPSRDSLLQVKCKFKES